MRVLILSANTGGGHNSTANALGEQLEKINVEYKIEDALSYISENFSEFISKGHSYIYRNLPKLFGAGYRSQENHFAALIYDQCARGAKALHAELSQTPYDAVVCTHVFGGLMMTEIRRKYEDFTPCYFISTDYTCHPGVSELKLDGYFIPHRMLLGEFVRNGVPADKLFATGIPVHSRFYEEEEKDAAREALGLPIDKKLVMLSCGSMGCGHMEKTALLLFESLPQDAALVVLCGNNKRTYEALQSYVGERLYAVSFTKQMWRYMSAADIYITKPGGLTTSEAIVKRVPMIFINAVPGCETRNYDFLIQRGVASGAKNWKQVIEAVSAALRDPSVLESQRKEMEQFSVGIAAEAICKKIME